MHSVQVQPPARTLPNQGIWGLTTSDDQASVQPPPPPSSLVASMHGSMTEASRLVRLAQTARSADARSSSSSWTEPVVALTEMAPVAEGWSAGLLEYYGGKSTGWKAYPTDVQEILREAVKEGTEKVEVKCDGKVYNICLLTMQQRHQGIDDGNVRALRWNRKGAIVRNCMVAYSWPLYSARYLDHVVLEFDRNDKVDPRFQFCCLQKRYVLHSASVTFNHAQL